MWLIGWIFFGLVVGVIAKLLMPGRDPGGFFITIVIGIVGALLARFIGRAIGWYDTNEGAGYIASILGAIILLALYRMVTGRKHVA